MDTVKVKRSTQLPIGMEAFWCSKGFGLGIREGVIETIERAITNVKPHPYRLDS